MIEAYYKNIWIITMEIWCWSIFPKKLQISHKTQTYILDGYISHLYKQVIQTNFQNFPTTFIAQNQSIHIVSGSPGIVSTGPKLSSFMQLCIKAGHPQISLWELLGSWKTEKNIDNLQQFAQNQEIHWSETTSLS